MKIDETTYKKMPAELQALFVKLPNYGSQEVMELFPDTRNGKYKSPNARPRKGFMLGNVNGMSNAPDNYGDSGSAARFFYCAKASRRERDAGLEDMKAQPRFSGGIEGASIPLKGSPMPIGKNTHPTVKPLALMSYLCKLVKMPEYNLILDPFCGSGSTLLACKKLGIRSIGIDSNEEYCEMAAKRCNV